MLGRHLMVLPWSSYSLQFVLVVPRFLASYPHRLQKWQENFMWNKVIVDVRKKHAVKSDSGHMSRELKVPGYCSGSTKGTWLLRVIAWVVL